MNLLKSIFVMAYMVLAVQSTVIAVDRLLSTRDLMSWGGVLLVFVPFLAVLTWLLILKRTPRTSRRFPVLIGLGIAGVILSAMGYLNGGSSTAPVLAMAGFGAFLVYDYWYSSFNDRKSDQLEPGQLLPSFELTNVAGDTVTSSALTDRATVWIFYRGNWCPLCMAQIKEVAAQYKELEDLGVRVALVSPQPHKFTEGLAKKFDVNFDFLTDKGNQAARALGIAHAFGLPMGMQVLGYSSETVMPTVIITEAGGRILWVDETDNYRVRPEPGTYLDVLAGRALEEPQAAPR
jgi:peroxiredoxin